MQHITPTRSQEMHKLCYDAYNGVGGFLDKSYLHKFSREESEYEERKKYSEYENKIAGIVESLVTPVYSNPIQRLNTNIVQEAFIENATGTGISLDDFMHDVAIYHRLQKNTFIIMDNYADVPENLVEAIKTRSYPYLYYKLPQDIYHYEVDRKGELTSIDFYYNTATIDKKEQEIYRHIDALWQYDYYISNKKQVLVSDKLESATNGLPVVQTGTEVIPVPTMYSLCSMAKGLFNKQSVALQSERGTGFHILQIPMDKVEKDIVIKNVIGIPDDSQKDVKFVSPDSKIFNELWNSAERTSTAIDDVAKSYGAIPILTQGQTSGVAYAYEFAGNTFALTQLANIMTKVENKIFDLFASFFKFNNEVEVIYDTNYTPGKTFLQEQYTLYKEAVDRKISPTATEIYNQELIKTINSMTELVMSDTQIKAINKELEVNVPVASGSIV